VRERETKDSLPPPSSRGTPSSTKGKECERVETLKKLIHQRGREENFLFFKQTPLPYHSAVSVSSSTFSSLGQAVIKFQDGDGTTLSSLNSKIHVSGELENDKFNQDLGTRGREKGRN
jgi:hypothetical protein